MNKFPYFHSQNDDNGKKVNSQKPPQASRSSSIINAPQSFLIWWAGAKPEQLPKHLRKAYAGLGAMAMVSTTLATFGGYSFVLISLGSAPGAVAGSLLAGYFMWGMDRSVLGFAVKDTSSSKKSKQALWVKLAINVAFSSILTLPLSVYIQRGAVQVQNMDRITAQIEKVDKKIANQENKITSLEKKKEKIDANWRFGNRADGSINEDYFKDKEQARQAVEKAKREKSDLVLEKKELKEEYRTFERGDISQVYLSFPEQFNYVMSEARFSDNLLNFLFFTITALMGAGAVLIKTFVFGTDSYTKKLQGLEDTASNEEELKYVMNTSAKQIYYSLFNTDVMGERMKSKLQRLQREFESEIERLAEWLCDARTEQISQKVQQQAVEEGLDWNYDHQISRHDTEELRQKGKAKRQPQKVTQKKDKSRKRRISEQKTNNSSDFSINIDRQSQDKFNRSKVNNLENKSNGVLKIGTNEDFMTLFGKVDHKISQQQNISFKKNQKDDNNHSIS